MWEAHNCSGYMDNNLSFTKQNYLYHLACFNFLLVRKKQKNAKMFLEICDTHGIFV